MKATWKTQCSRCEAPVTTSVDFCDRCYNEAIASESEIHIAGVAAAHVAANEAKAREGELREAIVRAATAMYDDWASPVNGTALRISTSLAEGVIVAVDAARKAGAA